MCRSAPEEIENAVHAQLLNECRSLLGLDDLREEGSMNVAHYCPQDNKWQGKEDNNVNLQNSMQHVEDTQILDLPADLITVRDAKRQQRLSVRILY